MRKLMSGAHIDDREQLQSLEEQGFYVIHTPEGYRPLQALSRTRGRDGYALSMEVPSPLHVTLFGWFRAEIDRRPIPWIRRRDRQVFKYLALQPGGSASRAELALVSGRGRANIKPRKACGRSAPTYARRSLTSSASICGALFPCQRRRVPRCQQRRDRRAPLPLARA